jgi:hypothetical protein
MVGFQVWGVGGRMKPLLIKAKYRSRCLFCGQEIEVGEEDYLLDQYRE